MNNDILSGGTVLATATPKPVTPPPADLVALEQIVRLYSDDISVVEAARRLYDAKEIANAAIAARPSLSAQAVELDTYDAGLLNDFGGGNVEWWQDYIRAELARAHDYYQSQTTPPHPADGGDSVAELVEGARHLMADYEQLHAKYDLGESTGTMLTRAALAKFQPAGGES